MVAAVQDWQGFVFHRLAQMKRFRLAADRAVSEHSKGIFQSGAGSGKDGEIGPVLGAGQAGSQPGMSRRGGGDEPQGGGKLGASNIGK